MVRGCNSVDFDLGVDLPDEDKGGPESDGSGENPEGEDDDEGVAEVEEGGDEGGDLELKRRTLC